jgi:phage tail-like protein
MTMKKEEIKQLLPAVFQRTAHPNSLLIGLLDVMETLHAPREEILENIDAIFDPRRTSDEFVPFLASWVDLHRLFEDSPADKRQDRFNHPNIIENGRLRELVAKAAFLSQWRGTKKGLLLFLQIATGEEDFAIEEKILDDNNQSIPFHILIRAPEKCLEQKDLIERIVEFEKPVYVTYQLEFLKSG